MLFVVLENSRGFAVFFGKLVVCFFMWTIVNHFEFSKSTKHIQSLTQPTWSHKV